MITTYLQTCTRGKALPDQHPWEDATRPAPVGRRHQNPDLGQVYCITERVANHLGAQTVMLSATYEDSKVQPGHIGRGQSPRRGMTLTGSRGPFPRNFSKFPRKAMSSKNHTTVMRVPMECTTKVFSKPTLVPARGRCHRTSTRLETPPDHH